MLSPQDTSLFLAQGQHNLSTAMAIQVHGASAMRCIASTMEKVIADHLGFAYIDINITKGLPNTSDITKLSFKLTPPIMTS
jgi:hypothetical protein